MLRARSEFLILFSLTFGLFLQALTANGLTDWQEDGLLRQEALTAVWQLRQTDLKTDNKPLLVSSCFLSPQTADASLLQFHALVAFFCRCVCFHIATNLQTYIIVPIKKTKAIWYKFAPFQLWTWEVFLVCSTWVLFLLCTGDAWWAELVWPKKSFFWVLFWQICFLKCPTMEKN